MKLRSASAPTPACDEEEQEDRAVALGTSFSAEKKPQRAEKTQEFAVIRIRRLSGRR